MAKKGGLGRGLDALFSDNSTDSGDVTQLPLSEIEPNKDQPRRDFDEESLAELSDSIARHGVIQPLLVRPVSGGAYQLVAGERRWRAARMAGLTSVPVTIRELSDSETMEIALIENLQREDLNPVEEAMGYKALMDNYGLTQEETAARVGKSRPVIANAVRLLSLPENMLDALREGEISSGHARAILGLDDDLRGSAFEMAVGGATVREIEGMARKKRRTNDGDKKPRTLGRPIYNEVEQALKDALGRRITVRASGGKGILEIEFYGDDDLVSLANSIAANK